MESTDATEKVANEKIAKDFTSPGEPIPKPTELSSDTPAKAEQDASSTLEMQALTLDAAPTPQPELIPHAEPAPQAEASTEDVAEPKEHDSRESVLTPPPDIPNEGTTATKDANLAESTVVPEPNPKEGHSEDEDLVAGDANKTGTPGPKQKTGRSRAIFDKPINLPDSDASDLTDGQISLLIRQSPTVRKGYQAYFTATGIIRPTHYHLVFARDASGDLTFPETIIKSNVHKWEETLERYEAKSAGPFRRTVQTTPAKRTTNDPDDTQTQTPPPKRARTRPSPSVPSAGHSKSPRDSPLFVSPDDSSSAPGSRSQKGTTGRNILTFPNPQGKKQKGARKDTRKDTQKQQTGHESLPQTGHPENIDSEEDSVLRPAFNNTLCRWVVNREPGDLSLLRDAEITEFTKWFDHEVKALHENLLAAANNGTEKDQEILINALHSLYGLRRAVRDLRNHLETEQGSTQNNEQDEQN